MSWLGLHRVCTVLTILRTARGLRGCFMPFILFSQDYPTLLKSGLWWGQSITPNVPLCVFLSRYMYTALAECGRSSDQMWVRCISYGITFINLLQPPTHDCRCSLLYFFSDSLHTYWHIFFYSNLDCHSRRAVAIDSRFIFYVIWHTSVFSLCFSSIFFPKFWHRTLQVSYSAKKHLQWHRLCLSIVFLNAQMCSFLFFMLPFTIFCLFLPSFPCFLLSELCETISSELLR